MNSSLKMIPRLAIRTSRPLCIRYTSSTTTASGPPMLLKIRTDLKTAMRAKDIPRLSVLRSLLATTLNASKTASPITTDLQMLSLVRKNIETSKAAALEFSNNGRSDLADKELSQVAVLEEYAGSVETVPEEEIVPVVMEVVGQMAMEGASLKQLGKVIERVLERFEGRMVEKGVVVGVVRNVLAEYQS